MSDVNKLKLVHATRKGALVAEFRYGATEHIRAFKRGSWWWFSIRLGKKRMLTCDCGGTVKYLPNEMHYDEKWGGCSHIVALFKGNVTDNEKESTDYGVSYDPFRKNRKSFARLTQLGQRMFFWRWTAHRLG